MQLRCRQDALRQLQGAQAIPALPVPPRAAEPGSAGILPAELALKLVPADSQTIGRGEEFIPLTQEQYIERGVDPQVVKWYFEYDNPTGGEAIPKFLHALSSGEVRSAQQDIMDLVVAGRTAEAATDLVRSIMAMVDNMTYSEIARASGEKPRSFHKNNLEQVIGFALANEVKAMMGTLDGRSLDGQSYLNWGQDQNIPYILAASSAVCAQALAD